jgi:hypothetical protein
MGMLQTRSSKNRQIAIYIFFAIFLVLVRSDLMEAESAPFDLVGPTIQMKVMRGGKTLPIANVPNLQVGDRLWVHADFPSYQSAHYVMIVAFLQGPTNPPPEDWFTRIETWNKSVREEGAFVNVPEHAEQALLLLVPDTSGAYGTVRSTVRGKPGIFVRATQDLEQASLDRTRIDKFLEEIKDGSTVDATPIPQRVGLLSRSLAVKADAECFNKPVEEQSTCLTQDTGRLVLQDTQSQSIVATLTSGPSADLVGSLSTTPVVRGGYYSPYVGSALDIARLLNTLHSADLRYLPALALPKKEDLHLKLNSPPSFQKPESVLIVGLPGVADVQLPALRPVDPKQVFCLQNTSLVLPVEGTPLVFSTSIAHEFVLHLQSKSGASVDLPATADAARGGFTVDIRKLHTEEMDGEVTGTLRGLWGFDSYAGPSFQLRNARAAQWTVPSSDANSLLVGRTDTLHLKSGCASCVESVSAQDSQGKDFKPEWKILHPEELEVSLPLNGESAGTVKLQVKQFGLTNPDTVILHTFSEAAHLDHFKMNAGDRQGVLTGTRLDEVDAFEMNGVQFTPAKLSHLEHEDALGMEAANAAAVAAFTPEEKVVAHVKLKDGRELDLQTTVDQPRPSVALVAKTVKHVSSGTAVRLGSPDELPQNGQLTFLLKARVPDKFARSEQIEVATTDGASDALLSVAGGNLVLQDSENALAILDPLKNLGPSAFGPLQFRPVDADGGKGDWLPLTMLVRTPTLIDIHCPEEAEKACLLSGSNLFLLDSVASDRQFKDAVAVPAGYADSTLSVPRPVGTLLFLKLRDDPATVDTVALPVLPDGQ